LGERIRWMQIGIDVMRLRSDLDSCSSEMMEDVAKNEKNLPSAELSFEHLRIRCGIGMSAKGEIDVDEAKSWLKKAPHRDIQALGRWEEVPDCVQQPIQVALQYLCDNDLSWANCQRSLLTGRKFTNELMEFGVNKVTRGKLDSMILAELSAESILREERKAGSYTALALCIFMDSVINANKIRYGIPAPPPPPPIDFCATKPHRVEFRQLLPALEKARQMERTPLLVCSEKEVVIATFFDYMCAVVIDAKRVINEVLVKKIFTMEEMREDIRQKIASAVRFGRPLHIRLGNSAIDWNVYFNEGGLPVELFHAGSWQQQSSWSKAVLFEELGEACFNFDSHFVFITSDMSLDGVQEHLPSKIPLFDRLAIIDIDPNSICN